MTLACPAPTYSNKMINLQWRKSVGRREDYLALAQPDASPLNPHSSSYFPPTVLPESFQTHALAPGMLAWVRVTCYQEFQVENSECHFSIGNQPSEDIA